MRKKKEGDDTWGQLGSRKVGPAGGRKVKAGGKMQKKRNRLK